MQNSVMIVNPVYRSTIMPERHTLPSYPSQQIQIQHIPLQYTHNNIHTNNNMNIMHNNNNIHQLHSNNVHHSV